MANLLISATTQRIWLKTAEILKNNYNFNVQYWICQQEFFDEVTKSHPDAVVHNRIDLCHGQFPDVFEDHDFLNHPIDSEIITNHASSALQSLKMMDRIDPGQFPFESFDYESRIRHYHRLLSYCYHVVEQLDIDIAIFESSPHTVGDYVLYQVLRELEIDMIIFYSTFSDNRKLIKTDLNGGFQFKYCSNRNYELSEKSRSKINLIQSDYDLAQPAKEKQLSTPSFLDFVTNRFRKANYSLKELFRQIIFSLTHLNEQHPNSFIKVRSGNIENNETTRLFYYVYRALAFNKRRSIKLHYDHLSIEPNFESDYIYYNLHFQPEKSTSPDAGHYVHQYLAVNLLSKSLPEDVQLYVKEHPSQFSGDKFGEQGRRIGYYTDLLNLNNVKLIKMSADQFELVDNALAVATCTGTVGWESLVRGTPVLSFGQPWYSDCPGCYTVTNQSNLSKAMDSIFSQGNVKITDVQNYAGLIESKSLNFKPDVDNANILAKKIINVANLTH